MWSGDHPGLQNRRAAGFPVAGAFDSHTLPPILPSTCASYLGDPLTNQPGNPADLKEMVRRAIKPAIEK